jgi:small subunit ribosomal protein S15e
MYFVLAQKRAMYKDMYFVPKLKTSVLHVPPERMNLIAKLNKEKIAVEGTLERPKPVKTHLRDIMILPQMVGNIIGIYNGKQMLGVEVKAEMVGTYTGEYGITYKPVRHGRPGIGSTHSSRFIPLK